MGVLKWLEKRATLTEETVRAIEARATGEQADAALDATAAVEAAAGFYARTFASVDISGAGQWERALGPAWWALVGRSLVRHGASRWVISVDPSPALLPACDFDVSGGADRASWRWKLTVQGPSRQKVYRVPDEGLLNLRWGTDPSEPWKGRGPLSYASLTARQLAEVDSLLGDVAHGPRGSLLPIPVPPATDADDSSLDSLTGDIRKLKGSVALVETQRAAWGSGEPGTTGANDWRPQSITPEPADSLPRLYGEAGRAIMAAVGLSGLFDGGDGTGQRESYRRALHAAVEPLARLVLEELRGKLELPELEIDFRRLFAGDLAGRARAFQSLVGGGMEIERAATLAGLITAEE